MVVLKKVLLNFEVKQLNVRNNQFPLGPIILKEVKNETGSILQGTFHLYKVLHTSLHVPSLVSLFISDTGGS